MIIWNDETKKKIATKIANRLSERAIDRLTERYYENEENKVEYYIDETIEKEMENYFQELDTDDFVDDLPKNMFDENGYFKDKEYHINDEVKELLEDWIAKELKSILKNFAEDFDYSDPNSLATYGLSQKDFL